MSTLDRKLLRDLWRLRGQVLAIALVIGAAMATLVLSLGTQRSLLETRDAYYERNRFAHVFLHLKRAPVNLAERIQSLPGVAQVDSRIVHWILIDMPGVAEPVRGQIVSLPEQGEQKLNVVFLRAGRFMRAGRHDEIVVHEAFAEAHGLKPGDQVVATINGRLRRLDVVGIGLSPEFVYAIGVGDVVPDHRRYGVLWMGREAIEAAFDLKSAFNDVAVLLRRDAIEAEVIARLDHLLEFYGGFGAHGRDDQISHAFLKAELDQLETLTRVIPPIFLVVGVFLLNVVISRLVQTEREQIGLLKAFGHTDLAVGWHYLKFAIAIGLLGAAIGALAGAWLGRGMTELYATYFRFPILYYRLSPGVVVFAGLLSLAAACSGAALAVRRAARLAPAIAMAPAPPTVYRRGLSDWLGLSRWMTPGGRMIVRHIARWPLRSALTVCGLALSVGLLVNTLYFYDAVDEMIHAYFFGSQRESVTVRFIEARQDAVRHELGRLPGVLRTELGRVAPVRLRRGHLIERAPLLGFDPGSEMSRLTDAMGREIVLPAEGLVLGDAMARKLQVQRGDLVTVEFLEGQHRTRSVAIAEIATEYVGMAAYMDRQALNRLMGESPRADSAKLMIDRGREAALFRALKDTPDLFSVTVRSSAVATFRAMIDEMFMTMVMFYVVFATVICVGVIYNSARITLSERGRELASLRVLGYHRSEVAAILVGELALLTLMALPLGCLSGYGLVALMVAMFSTDLYRLPLIIEPSTYGYAAVITLVSAALTGVITARRIAGLDLIAVLKTRE